MQIYNTLSRRKEDFVPQDEERVTMYVCGPTVYSYAHIGNARPAVVFDVLARLLRRKFKSLCYVRNITDIDDKINAAAAARGVDIAVIADEFTRAYHGDLEHLGALPPDVEPKATANVNSIIDMIEVLIAKGHAYAAQGHVLFQVPSFPEYGKLSNRTPDEMLAGARVEVAPYKKSPADFVLWKPSTGDLPGWDSPWGFGRPGWHIECSVMAKNHLGATVDIHGGGHDLIFPHHENELAQSTCAHDGAPLARYWVHNGFVNVDSEKMSKSLGNVLLVRDLLEQAPGEAIRLALLSAHYRAPLDWSDDAVAQSKRRLDGLYQALDKLADAAPPEDETAQPSPAFMAALEDDLNTPKALAELSALARSANVSSDPAERSRIKAGLLASGWLLGLLQQDPREWFAGKVEDLDTDLIDKLICDRNKARQEKDYGRADAVRKELFDMGIAIEDGPGGTSWRRL